MILTEKELYRSNYSKMDVLFSYVLVLLAFTFHYKSPISLLSFGEFLLVPFLFYYLIKDKGEVLLRVKSWYLFIAVVFFTTMFNSFFYYFVFSEAITIFMRMIFYTLIILIAQKHFAFKTAGVFHSYLSVLFSIYLIIQYAVYKAFNIILPIYFNYNWLFGPSRRAGLENLAEGAFRFVFRPSSMFLEPSHFTIFILPALAFILFFNEKVSNKYKIFAVIITIALIASTSISGLIGAAIIWLMYIMKHIITIKQKVLYISKNGVLTLLFISALLFILLNSSLANVGMDRLSEGGSFDQRITRGIIIFDKLDTHHKIFGIGVNNITEYMNHYKLSTPYDETILEMMSSLVSTFVTSGLIGGIFLIVFLLHLFKTQKLFYGKVLVLILSFMVVYESILFTYKSAILLVELFILSSISRSINETEQVSEPEVINVDSGKVEQLQLN